MIEESTFDIERKFFFYVIIIRKQNEVSVTKKVNEFRYEENF